MLMRAKLVRAERSVDWFLRCGRGQPSTSLLVESQAWRWGSQASLWVGPAGRRVYTPLMRRFSRARFLAVLVALLAMLAACSETSSLTSVATSEQTTASLPTTTATELVTTSTSRSLPPDAVPPELSGTWETEMVDGHRIHLFLRENRYTAQVVRTPDSGNGKVSVNGDTITFSDSDRCPGDPGGTYSWVIENGELSFTLIGTDPCGRNGAFLNGFTFTLFRDHP